MTARSPAPRRMLGAFATLALVTAACGDDDSGSADTGAPTSEDSTPGTETATTEGESAAAEAPAGTDPEAPSGDQMAVSAGAPFPEARCAANEEVGTLTFLTGFDFAAAASIVEVIVADEAGYYDEVCLDVELKPSFSTANYPLVASGDAHFASGGSFSEVVAFADANEVDLLAMTVDARTPIESLLVKPGVAETLEDLEGTTLGVKGKLPTSIEVMLADAGLVEGENFDTVLLDGFDPMAHIAIEPISGFSVWKSNEPGTLERAGVEFDLFDPGEEGVPGSFGVIFASRDFVTGNPTAAEDFVRATMRGLADAVADPDAAANTAVALINANGNPSFLSPEGEVFRWNTEAGIIASTTPEGTGYAIPDDASLQEELDAATGIGLFGENGAPSAAEMIGADITAGVYDAAGQVIWPD